MPTRRTLLAATGAGLAAGTAGCLDLITGDTIEFEASPGRVSTPALDDTGYEEHEIEDRIIEREFEAGGQSREVVVTNWQAEYDKAVDLSDAPVETDERARAAVFTVITTPQVSVLGQEFNPIAEMDTQEIAEMAQDRFDGLDDLEHTGSESVSVLRESTTADRFVGEAELLETGFDVDTVLWITESVESGDDHVVVIGGYPELIEDGEKDNFLRLVEGVEHDDED